MGWQGILKGLGYFSAGLVIIGTGLPLIPSNDWWIRIFDFPRFQLTAAGALVLVVGISLWRHASKLMRGAIILSGIALIVQAVQIFPYSPLKEPQTLRAPSRIPEAEFSLLTSNVLQDNRDPSRLLELINEHDPDLVLLTEVDSWWLEQMSAIERDYAHSVKRPLTNYYGMALYSKLELIDASLQHLVKPDIPSIRAKVRLRDGRLVQFYGVHPEPPGSSEPDGGIRGTAPRDAELVLIAREAQKDRLPTVVAGDFNDVAWSHTTRLFQRLSRTLDPRVGRGFYNTFHAEYFFLRYPLDHLFHSDDFYLAEFERLPHIGSDHFPIFAALQLHREAEQIQEAPAPKPDDAREAAEAINDRADE